jgi:hypothetical protein
MFNTTEINLNGDYAFIGLVFKKNKKHIWNQYKGWDYFNNLILKGDNKELFLEKMDEMVLELTHIYLSYSILFKYLTFAMLSITFFSIINSTAIFILPALTLMFYLLKIFFFRKAIREYHTLYDKNIKEIIGFVYRDKTLIILPLKEKIKKFILFLFIW